MARPRIQIVPTDDVLEQFGNQIAALGERSARPAFARAINRTTDMVRTRVIRALVRQTSIPRKYLVREVKTRKMSTKASSEEAFEGIVFAKGNPIPLAAFKPAQFSWGVRAKVWGRFQRFPGAFIYAGTWKSGQPVSRGNVFVRTTKESLPIEMMFGPSIPEEMVKGESLKAYEETVLTVLPARIRHEIGRLLPQ